MAKRFIDGNLWDKPWFDTLDKETKLLFIYLFSKGCDHSGVWTVNEKLASFHIGVKIDLAKAIDTLKGHIHIFDDAKKWWLVDFIDVQYGTLSETSKPHISVINLLKKHGLIEIFANGIDTLSIGLDNPYARLKDKDKDKDKVKEKHLDFVFLTKEEYQSLKDRFPDLHERIERLNTYIGQKGDKYKSHYFTIIAWADKDKKEKSKPQDNPYAGTKKL
jgi:hypothetical protein